MVNRNRIYVLSEFNPLLALEGAQSMPYEAIKVTSYRVCFPTASGANAHAEFENSVKKTIIIVDRLL